MAGEQELILELFKHGKEFSTTEIVEKIYSEELHEEKNTDIKAKYHRKLIYHLNKLVENRVLKVSGYKSKGEKCFSIARDIIVELPNKKLKLARKDFDLSGLELDQDSVFEYKPFGIMINSAIINAQDLELSQLSCMLKEVYSEINDVIAVHRAEHLFTISNLEELEHFFIGIEAILDRRKLVFIFDYNNPKTKYLNKIFSLLKNKNIELVILLDDRNFLSQSSDLQHFFEEMKDNDLKINISENAEEISYSGNTGVYSTELGDELLEIVGINSVCLDLEKIKEFSASEIKDKLMRIVKGLHHVNIYQQIEFENIFPVLSSYQGKISKGANSIRIWNYDWKNDEYLLELFEDLKEEILLFTRTEENIYMSCGIPMSFKIKLGSAFRSFNREKLSKRNYQKEVVYGFSDLKDNFSQLLRFRAKYFSLFETGDRLRIFRNSENTKTLLQEMHFILSSNIPYFTYDFRTMNKEINLRDFM